MFAGSCHLQHMRIFFIDEEKGTIVDCTQTNQQIADFRDRIHWRVVTVCRRISKLLQQIFVVLLLQQHNHVVEEKNAKLDCAFFDGQQPVMDELVVCEVDVLELVGRFFLVRRFV